MRNDEKPEKEVETHRGSLGKAERMTRGEARAREELPPISPNELDMRQESIGERRKPAGPQTQQAAVLEEASAADTPDVPPTDCEEARPGAGAAEAEAY